MSKLSDFLHNVETVATIIEADAFVLLKGVVHLVEMGAPIAAVVGGAIGQPEVVAGATAAATTATAVDKVIQSESANSDVPASTGAAA